MELCFWLHVLLSSSIDWPGSPSLPFAYGTWADMLHGQHDHLGVPEPRASQPEAQPDSLRAPLAGKVQHHVSMPSSSSMPKSGGQQHLCLTWALLLVGLFDVLYWALKAFSCCRLPTCRTLWAMPRRWIRWCMQWTLQVGCPELALSLLCPCSDRRSDRCHPGHGLWLTICCQTRRVLSWLGSQA